MTETKWIPEVNKDSMNWSTYSKNGKKKGYWAPTPLLFIDPKVVCSNPKAKVC